MAALAVGAYLTTRAAIRQANSFTFAPIIEVAVLFAGIFLTMIAPLQILNARGDQLPLDTTAFPLARMRHGSNPKKEKRVRGAGTERNAACLLHHPPLRGRTPAPEGAPRRG